MTETLLSAHEIERYSRQLMLRNWSQENQLALKHLHVAFSPCFPTFGRYLAQAGVGNLFVFVEPDWETCARELMGLNPYTQVTPWEDTLNSVLDYAFFGSILAAKKFPLNSFSSTEQALLYFESDCITLENNPSRSTSSTTSSTISIPLASAAFHPVPQLTTLLAGTLAATMLLHHFQERLSGPLLKGE